LRYEKRQDLEANFVHLFEGNSQAAIFENKCTKFDREITFFRVEKPKTQVNKRLQNEELCPRFEEDMTMADGEKDFRALVGIIDRLLGPDGCPWDKEQTVLSLSHMILEEVCEVIDTLQETEPENLADELGDLLSGTIFLAKVAEKEGRFSWELPFQKIAAKLIRRHPHIFSDEKLATAREVEVRWDEIKATEKEHAARKSRFDGIPKSLPALAMMQKLMAKAKKVPALQSTAAKLVQKEREDEEEELGRRIAQLVFEAESKGVQAEHALRRFFTDCRNDLANQEKSL
jgi:tetrapyrrole methylase family protein / MazG family protein